MELFEMGSQFVQSEVTRMTIAFVIAARLHRGWVKKDMKEQFSIITKSIDNLGKVIGDGLELHSKRIDELTVRVDKLEKD